MITEATSEKVTARHLTRNAYVYVRPAALGPVVGDTERTQRQYALRQRALALGWPAEHIIVLDQDLGQSGAATADRVGFQILVTEVGRGRAGIVLARDCSRLARNSRDWHQVLELCSLTDTLILLEEDGLYDPVQFNDPLRLGLNGTMSKADRHVLRARLRAATPAPTPSAEGAGRSNPTAASSITCCRAISGWFFCTTLIPATSPGPSTSRSSNACAPTRRPSGSIAAMDLRAKVPPCCKAWSSAVAVACA